MAALYANENFPFIVVEALRALGHDVLTSREAGNANQRIPDQDVLAFAAQNQRAVLTINRDDFIRLHRLNPNHAGIIVCTQDSDLPGQSERIDHAIRGLESLSGQLVRVNRPAP
jgi:predicted nuclease of predicted toxin-antitoxin system